MGLCRPVSDTNEARRPATRLPVARSVQCFALDCPGWFAVAIVANQLFAVACCVPTNATLDCGTCVRDPGGRLARNRAGGSGQKGRPDRDGDR